MGMNMNSTTRASKAYIGTFEYGSADDMLELEEIKCMVKNMNRMLREDGRGYYQYRVVLRGRQPVEKQEVNVYSYGTGLRDMRKRSYDYFGNVVGGIANASKVDAYIYQR
jgi:tRNA isopentenyl-2-thiomethyl-A-37 hydroxylase MiaE